ncbi:MAG: hypothetical protein ACRERE_08155 [Candidatus Entotheonellia bacterium]
MRLRREVPIWAALVAFMMVSARPSNGQPLTVAPAAPNKVETRLGTLHFFDGFPDRASAEKLYDALDFQRAVQAYLHANHGHRRARQTRWHSASRTIRGLYCEELDPARRTMKTNLRRSLCGFTDSLHGSLLCGHW